MNGNSFTIATPTRSARVLKSTANRIKETLVYSGRGSAKSATPKVGAGVILFWPVIGGWKKTSVDAGGPSGFGQIGCRLIRQLGNQAVRDS